MKRTLFRIPLCLFLILSLLTGLFACGATEEEKKPSSGVYYDDARLSEYIAPFAYEGLTVELSSADALKSEAVWALILSRAEILSYPEDAVAYYAEQIRDTYRYYAKENDWSYERTLEFFGRNEESILSEAREMVKGDLAYRYIVKDAGISLSDEDKSAQLDRYVAKLAADYGYTEDYVREQMLELVYDSMLYDKTMEHLMMKNTFVQK